MPIDNTVTRFQNGVTNAADNAPFNNLKVPDRTVYHEFNDDFDKYTAAQWAVGGVNPVAPVLAAGDGGILAMATTGANADSNYIQQAANAYFLTQGSAVVQGKRTGFKFRGILDDVTAGLLGAGLQIAVAANNFLTPADGLFLRKPAADTNIYLVHRVGGVEILSLAMGVLTNAVAFEAGFWYDGQTNVLGFLNGQNKVSITVPVLTAVGLRVTVGVQANTVAARTLSLDQLYAAKER